MKPPTDPASLHGMDVEFTFAGNFITPSSGDGSQPRFTGTLTATPLPDEDGLSVRLVTNHPLEDSNGREVYQVNLDQSSVDSLHRHRDTDVWTLRLPDLVRPAR
ncbi:MAG: hypothetical protein EOP85_01655 [Verrucomicrobiaceae bacterium]|nr:MAG: hypothetical protein EOP85_01655 [Verrucomicrobiaceae bacterium]